MPTVIEIKDLTRSFGAVEAVRGVTLSVERGELFGLIGPNGAGKTTLFRMLLGLVRPTSGTIRINGVEVSSVWSRELRATTGYLPENIAFYDHMTGVETLSFYARIKGAPASEVPPLVERVGLAGAASRKVGEYSKGMRQRLGLAQALLGRPRFLFLDEPTSGLDPEGIWDFYTVLEEAKKDGVTVVLTSHILKEIQDRVDSLGIIGDGRLLASGTVGDLRTNLGLKPTVFITYSGDGAGLREAVAKGGGTVVSERARSIGFSCAPADKTRLLKDLLAREEVTDVQVCEPSLEDVFMGYARRDD